MFVIYSFANWNIHVFLMVTFSVFRAWKAQIWISKEKYLFFVLYFWTIIFKTVISLLDAKNPWKTWKKRKEMTLAIFHWISYADSYTFKNCNSIIFQSNLNKTPLLRYATHLWWFCVSFYWSKVYLSIFWSDIDLVFQFDFFVIYLESFWQENLPLIDSSNIKK